MSAIFKNEDDIKKYVIQAASLSTNIKVYPDGKHLLNYRNLETKIGVICYVLTKEKILILERSPTVNFGNQWGTVSGYVDDLEIISNSNQFCRDHLIGEFQEEINWTITDPATLKYCGTHALIKPNLKIHFEIFSLVLIEQPPAITLNSEHINYRWVDRDTIEKLRPILITQFLEGLEIVAAVKQ
jgi:8-oxo-dGTP pyrophosphatase MutT (NUDIX family)